MGQCFRKCVTLMVKCLALEAVRGGALKDLASSLSKCTLLTVLAFFVQSIVPLSHVHTGGPTVHFLQETGIRESDKEAVSAAEKVWVLEMAWLDFKSLTPGRKLTFPEHQVGTDGETEAQRN